LTVSKEEFVRELKAREPLITEVFNQDRYQRCFRPEPLKQAVYSYLKRPAKRFRPGILLFSCGALGGEEKQAILAAAAVEVYHTWTLVHDDVIDWGCTEVEAIQMGRNVAILTGDLQHAWSVRLLLDSSELGVSLPVIFDLIKRLEDDLTNGLVAGEALDVLFAHKKISELSEAEVLEMLELKTGILYEFAAMAGASIGLGQTAKQNSLIEVLGRFARRCGTAFQLQDDILGIIGDEKLLGKAVGSDIREGKRTTIVLHAFQNATATERQFLEDYLGNATASEQEVEHVRRILIDNNGIDYTCKLAESIVSQAIQTIVNIPESRYKELLLTWAKYVVNRDF
jgi:geranylgeranyl diphosphate synthase type I